MPTITQASESGPTSGSSGLGYGGMTLAMKASNSPAAFARRSAAPFGR